MVENPKTCSDYYYGLSPDGTGRKLLCDLKDGHDGLHHEVLRFEAPPGPDLTIYWKFSKSNEGEQ